MKAGLETPSCSVSLPSPDHGIFCAQPHLSLAGKICVAGEWVSIDRDFSGCYQWKWRHSHNKGQYQLFSSLLKARWHLCNYLQLCSTLPTAEKTKRIFWSACPWAIALLHPDWCIFDPWSFIATVWHVPRCFFLLQTSCSLRFYVVSLRAWLAFTSLPLNAFKLIEGMVKRMLCGTVEQIANNILRGGFEVN